MEISFRSKKLADDLANFETRQRAYGKEMAKKIGLRLDALVAADNLATFWPPLSGPPRCHALTGDLAGQFSMDLKQPFRLIFEPVGVDQSATVANELERWQAISAIVITGIEDTHG